MAQSYNGERTWLKDILGNAPKVVEGWIDWGLVPEPTAVQSGSRSLNWLWIVLGIGALYFVLKGK